MPHSKENPLLAIGYWLKSKAAFTLLEMIISVAMIVILSAIAIGYSHNSEAGLALATKKAELLGLLFNAKSLSQSFLLNPPVGKQICAYGVHIDSAAILPQANAFVFEDLAPSAGDCATGSDKIFTAGEGLTGETNNLYLPTTMQFGNASNLGNVIFTPPDPTVTINADPTKQSASVVVELKSDPTQYFTITVNKFGEITAE